MRTNLLRMLVFCALMLATASRAAADVSVSTTKGLQQAFATARPGTTIKLAPGTYAGGFYGMKKQGQAGQPITIAAADPTQKPVFRGGRCCMQFSGCAHIELRDIIFEDPTDNSLNIDDGSAKDGLPNHHFLMRGLVIRSAAAKGNHDGIKLSGLTDFRVEDCLIENWGNGGSGIDMVGCHDGVIDRVTLKHSGKAINGIEAKGGSINIVITRSRFENAGDRAVMIGGYSSKSGFRPPAPDHDAYEAKDCTVEGCTFIGSEAPIAFAGADGAIFRYNTIYKPGKWVTRILQESQGPEFVPCRNGVVTNNLIVFSSKLQSTANIGRGTAPETFKFADNFWYCFDAPDKSKPTLPSTETGAVIGKDPKFKDTAKNDLTVEEGSPAAKFGAHALP